MKAAIFNGANKPLEVKDVPTPQITDGEILVKVAACGACHTDLHYIDHGVPTFQKPPLVLGHEISGTVAELGKDVTSLKQGDRILLPAVLTCGRCVLCRQGRENICQNMQMFGNHRDGGFAEFVKAPAKDAIPLPPEIPLEEASIIADAVSTPYHAVVNRASVKPGDKVAIFGCGGVGINAVQIASALGAVVIAVDVDDKKLEFAKQFGAAEVVNAKNEKDVAKKIKSITGGGADIAMECIGNSTTIQQAHSSIRAGGRLCIVGYCEKPTEITVAKIMFFEQEIVGSLGCRPVDYPRIIEMARRNKIQIKPLVTAKFTLDKINEAFDNLRKGIGIRNIVVPR
ncbi:MAG: hypothetical protein A2W23_00100 [Planctomycetes bacterium RBG_16_43_13]|nr:MAG: hypothetical protein A2W23_00100 [Planctomycetes bacterium RBG_16_43_13]